MDQAFGWSVIRVGRRFSVWRGETLLPQSQIKALDESVNMEGAAVNFTCPCPRCGQQIRYSGKAPFLSVCRCAACLQVLVTVASVDTRDGSPRWSCLMLDNRVIDKSSAEEQARHVYEVCRPCLRMHSMPEKKAEEYIANIAERLRRARLGQAVTEVAPSECRINCPHCGVNLLSRLFVFPPPRVDLQCKCPNCSNWVSQIWEMHNGRWVECATGTDNDSKRMSRSVRRDYDDYLKAMRKGDFDPREICREGRQN